MPNPNNQNPLTNLFGDNDSVAERDKTTEGFYQILKGWALTPANHAAVWPDDEPKELSEHEKFLKYKEEQDTA